GVVVCCTPLTATITGPSTAVAGTVTVSTPDVAAVTVAVARRLLARAKPTRVFAGVALDLVPLVLIGAPQGAAGGGGAGVVVMVVTVGPEGRMAVPTVAVGARPTGASADASAMDRTGPLVVKPRSGLTTVTVRCSTVSAPFATSTFTARRSAPTKPTLFTVIP